MRQKQDKEFKSMPKAVLLLLLMAALTACGTTSQLKSVNDNQLAGIEAEAKRASGEEVSGYLVESDGATPIYNATIALLGKRADAFINRAETAHPCISPAKPNINFVCSKADGSFNLDVSQIQEFPVKISIEKEDEIHEIALTKQQLRNGLGVITFDTEPSQPKERIAVVMDFYNPIKEVQKLLSDNQGDTQSVALQLMNEYQNLFEIDTISNDVSYPTFYSLFVDGDNDGKADIFNYDVVYINSKKQSDISLLDKDLRAKLLDFLSNGGNLQITEWTVELEHAEPSLDQYI